MKNPRVDQILLVIAFVALLIAVPPLWKRMTAVSFSTHPATATDEVRPFNLANLSIPQSELIASSAQRDQIEALTDPQIAPPGVPATLHGDDRVAGIIVDGAARAYPLRILEFHEVVNDRLGGRAIAVTYCPLCDSVAVFDRATSHGEIELAVSGYLYNSNVILYDRQTESLWSQLSGQCLAGERLGDKLAFLPAEVTDWRDWLDRHRASEVLSFSQGKGRSYSFSPYGRYLAEQRPIYPVSSFSDRLPQMTPLLGVRTERGTLAFPEIAFSEFDEPVVLPASVGGISLSVHYDPRGNSLRIIDPPKSVDVVYSFWFAWHAFHPDTQIYDPHDIEFRTDGP